MKILLRLAKFGLLAALGASVIGCCIAPPYGRDHGYRGRGYDGGEYSRGDAHRDDGYRRGR